MFKVIFLFTVFNPVMSHVCDDVLDHDPIVIWPEMRQIEVVETGEFKIFLKNNYIGSIHNVRLIAPQRVFDIKISPVMIEQVAPGEEISFLVGMNIPEETKPGTYSLLMRVDALEFKVEREVNITVQVEEKEAVVEIVPEEVPVAISVFPDIIEVEPAQSTHLKVFVRSGYTKSLHNISLFIDEGKFKVNIVPDVIEEIKPEAMTFFTVNLVIPEGMEHGEYPLMMEVGADEFTVRRGVYAIIKVGEVKEEITYLYLLIILFLLLILVFRKIRIKL
jgi:uncharacterized membrane protein